MAFSAFLPSLALFLGFFVFIFYRAKVNHLPGFYKHFIWCSVELSRVPRFIFFISGGLKLKEPVVAWKSFTSVAFSAFLPSLALLLGFFFFIFYSAEVNQLPGFYQHFICCTVELSHVPGFFFFNSCRVEVKVICCSPELFDEPGLFCVFTLSGSLTWLFCFYLLQR